MGMYTGLRGQVVLNDEGLALYRADFDWGVSSLEAIRIFGQDGRSSFIPWGVHAYMPDSWGESFSRVEMCSTVWHFSCSLKNYGRTIEAFIECVLPLIADSWRLEKLHEENDQPEIFEKEAAQ